MQRETRTVLKGLGGRIREVRLKRGMTQEKTAEKLGMLTPNYARIEQGRMNTTVDTLVRIANVLDVALSEMFKAPKSRTVKPGRPPQGHADPK